MAKIVREPHVLEGDLDRLAVGDDEDPGRQRRGRVEGSVSSRTKMRSELAIAVCRMLYFSDRSWSGWKNRCTSIRNAATVPTLSDPASTRAAPATIRMASATECQQLDRREIQRVDRDRPQVRIEMGRGSARRSARPRGAPAAEQLDDSACR